MEYLTYDEIRKRDKKNKSLEKRIYEMSAEIEEKLASLDDSVLEYRQEIEDKRSIFDSEDKKIYLRREEIAILGRETRAIVSESGENIGVQVENTIVDTGNELSEEKLRKLRQLLRQRRLSLLQEVAFLFPVENSGGVRSICDLALDGPREEKGVAACLVGQALRLLSQYTGVNLQFHIQLLGENSYLSSNRVCACTNTEDELWKCNTVKNGDSVSVEKDSILLTDDDGIRTLTEEVRNLAGEGVRGGILQELERLMQLCTLEVSGRD